MSEPVTPEPVVLTAYDDAWPRIFESEADALRVALARYSLRSLEHVGSTAIAGMIGCAIWPVSATSSTPSSPRNSDRCRT